MGFGAQIITTISSTLVAHGIILIRRIIAEFRWIRNEQFPKILARLEELRDRLAVDGILEFFIEIRESVWRILLSAMPAIFLGSQSAIYKDGFTDLFGPNAFTTLLLLFPAPLIEDRQIRKLSESPSTMFMVLTVRLLIMVHVFIFTNGRHSFYWETHILLCWHSDGMSPLLHRILSWRLAKRVATNVVDIDKLIPSAPVLWMPWRKGPWYHHVVKSNVGSDFGAVRY